MHKSRPTNAGGYGWPLYFSAQFGLAHPSLAQSECPVKTRALHVAPKENDQKNANSAGQGLISGVAAFPKATLRACTRPIRG